MLLIAGGMSSKTTRNEEVADEIRTRTLVVVDDEGNVVGSFDASGVTMRQGKRCTEIGPSGIRVAYHERSSVKIGGSNIEVCGFDAEKYQQNEELFEQQRRGGLTKEEAIKIAYELRKNNCEPALVSISRSGNEGIIFLSDASGRLQKQITSHD